MQGRLGAEAPRTLERVLHHHRRLLVAEAAHYVGDHADGRPRQLRTRLASIRQRAEACEDLETVFRRAHDDVALLIYFPGDMGE